jgi:hypothetical protein
METWEHLEVSVALMEYLASISVIWKDHVKVVQTPTPEQEKEVIDRIISGLPTRPFFEEQENQILQGRLDSVVLTDAVSAFPSNMWEFLKEERPPSAHFTLEKDGTVTQNVKPEQVEFTSDDLEFNQIADGWRPIPGFSRYEMSKYQMIADASTGTSVSIVKGGRFDNVLLENDEGVMKRMSVKHLFEKTFPEY